MPPVDLIEGLIPTGEGSFPADSSFVEFSAVSLDLQRWVSNSFSFLCNAFLLCCPAVIAPFVSPFYRVNLSDFCRSQHQVALNKY